MDFYRLLADLACNCPYWRDHPRRDDLRCGARFEDLDRLGRPHDLQATAPSHRQCAPARETCRSGHARLWRKYPDVRPYCPISRRRNSSLPAGDATAETRMKPRCCARPIWTTPRCSKYATISGPLAPAPSYNPFRIGAAACWSSDRAGRETAVPPPSENTSGRRQRPRLPPRHQRDVLCSATIKVRHVLPHWKMFLSR